MYSGKDITILSGDLDTKDNNRYEEIIGRHGQGKRNENVERFANLFVFNKFVICGTIFPHRLIQKAIWVSPDDTTKNLIDQIFITKKFKRTIEDVIISRRADIASDQHLVVVKMKPKIKKL